MSAARLASNVMEQHNKIPFHSLVNEEDSEFVSEEKDHHGHGPPKIKKMVDKFVGNLTGKQRRYADEYPEYQHKKMTKVQEEGTYEQKDLQQSDRSTSLDEIADVVPASACSSNIDELRVYGTGRRRSRSESDLILECENFSRRRAAICEEMERSILMENGVTLRKCRKNLVLNQILENLSLL